MGSPPVLSQTDLDQFLERGFVKVEGCFDRRFADDMVRNACDRLYCSLDDPSSWPIGRTRVPPTMQYDAEQYAPRAWQAVCELLGGAERIERPYVWTDNFVINFGRDPSESWSAPGPEILPHQKWHADGDFFRHFLDSREQGLLVIPLFSDIEERGGGTHLACDSVEHVARFLAEHPEGVLLSDIPADDIVGRCNDFVEATGSVGDVYFMHPLMLHSVSVNDLDQARFIINPPVTLQNPMQFDRSRAVDRSLVEQVVLRALGTDRFDFTPTHPRETIVPDRVAQEKRDLEQRRVAASDRQ